MIVAELVGPLVSAIHPDEVIQRNAIEEVTTEIARYCYERIPLREGYVMHDIQHLSLQTGKEVPRRVQCNGKTVAKVYDDRVGYVIDLGF